MWSYNYTYPNYLAHYGVLGMKWGVRKSSYSQAKSNYKNAKKQKKAAYKAYKKSYNHATNHLAGWGNFAPSNTKIGKENARRWNDVHSKGNASIKADAAYKKAKSEYKNSTEYKTKRNNTLKTAAKIGVGVAAAGLAIYGGYKVSQMVRSNQANVAAGKRIMANYQKGQDYKANAKKMQNLYSKGYINAIHKSNDAYKIADTAMKGRLIGTGMIYNNGYHEALSNARSADKVVDAFQKKRDQYGIRAGGALSTILRTRN